jgi:hypothetical protein
MYIGKVDTYSHETRGERVNANKASVDTHTHHYLGSV